LTTNQKVAGSSPAERTLENPANCEKNAGYSEGPALGRGLLTEV